MPDRPIAAILLAAGRSARFGGSKLAADFRGKPLARWAADAARASKARPILAVTGQWPAEAEAAIGGESVSFVHNPDYQEGLAASLRAGVAALPAEVGGALICLADMPLVTGPLLDALIDAFRAAPAGTLGAAPVHEGRRGNPALIGRTLFTRIGGLRGDEGARRLLGALGERVLEVETADAGVFFDVDRRADLD